MTKIPAAFLALALFTTPALAASDGRLQTVHYEADKVVSVKGRLGFQSMIEFGQGESIENVAVGDFERLAGHSEQAGQSAVPEAFVR